VRRTAQAASAVGIKMPGQSTWIPPLEVVTALAVRDDKRERSAPVLVWMAIGTVFILTLVAVDYFGAFAIR